MHFLFAAIVIGYSSILSAHIIVSPTESYNKYILNWSEIKKDVKSNDRIPTICGEVNQLYIQAHDDDHVKLVVDGGWIKESQVQSPLEMVIQNEGRVGIGRHTSKKPCRFGTSGITLIANGDGEIDINTDIVINNHCIIHKGSDFVSGHRLLLKADEPHQIVITKHGVLDLRQFGTGDRIEFAGSLRIILEPGATIIMGGGLLCFSDTTCVVAQPFEKCLQIFNTLGHGAHSTALDPLQPTPVSCPHNPYAPIMYTGAGLQTTDDFRVKIVGTGTLEFCSDSCFLIPEDAFVGIQTLDNEIGLTDITVVLRDNAQFLLGDQELPGGTFQIGNTLDYPDHHINFTFSLQGKSARIALQAQAFMGFGVGIANKRGFPNDWIVGTTFNVDAVNILIGNGVLEHNRIFAGDDPNASLIAYVHYASEKPQYTLHSEDIPTDNFYKDTHANVLGGGNIIIITHHPDQLLHPIITNQDNQCIVGSHVHDRMRTGVLASRKLMAAHSKINVGPSEFFEFIKIKDYQQPGKGLGKASVAFKDSTHTLLRAAFVDRNKIGRDDIYDIDDTEHVLKKEKYQQAADLGALSIHVALSGVAPSRILFAQQLPA